ncbi:HMCN [Mytilus coruscus]|uniref:HMCN n=1 Tax=Mytilus coruscus TaxID=42192 RepID=A0A6J8BII9_MYTCO|nr:HMCN [Mytilus coruscus]
MVIEKQKDVIYTGHVAFEIFALPMWSLCAQLCTRLKICKSINFITLNETCQINVAEPNCSTSCLTNSVGDSFVAASALPKELAGICKGHACNITEICVPKSKSEGYLCHPLIGYRIVPPNVHIPQSSYDVIIGQSVTLVCLVTSHLPITDITWKKNINNSVSTIDSGGSAHLYSVPTHVHIPQPSYEVTYGKSVTLVCIVTSRLPLTDVTWKKNVGGSVSMIDPDDSASLYSGGNVESPSLIILNVTANDTGTYICSATNLVDTRNSDTISLVINCVPNVYVHHLLYNATFGSTVTLDCSVSTTTPATITEVYWQKWDGCQIKNISSTTTSAAAKYSGSTMCEDTAITNPKEALKLSLNIGTTDKEDKVDSTA